MKKRAFIKYTEYGKIIPGSMIVTQGSFPSKEGRARWYEVPMDKCCAPVEFNIDNFLLRMNSCYTQVTDLIPNAYFFTDYNGSEINHNFIMDGCDDMYDQGNMLNTNLTQPYADIEGDSANIALNIPYTHTQDPDEVCPYIITPLDGIITDGTNYFGAGSRYFTNMYPGMFIVAATGLNISEFSIVGGLGSDGDGINAAYIQTSHPGWTMYVKTNYDSANEDPSVNHILIVNGSTSGITQLYDNTGEHDDHCLQGLTSQNTSIIGSIVATQPGSPALTQEQALAIANKILDVHNNSACNIIP